MKITSFLTAALFGAHAATAAESVYLVNSVKGNEISSGIAYYKDGHSATGGSRPDDYVDVVHGSNIIWEGRTVKGTFGSGVSFTSNIFADAAGKQINACPGGKDWVLYTVDGWTVKVVYYCRPFN
ncbi:myroilysin precursor [Fusarium beomiforme]|uniref:Myroilysin n=1 Tax=Fusarium beomiforme TaxID=44412 RepID=A0A9P5AJ41_9HYPO|nr:myroilysin precursor [Fusarium beomiforme]